MRETNMSNIIFSGNLNVVVPEQVGLTRAQRRMIRDSFHDGEGLPKHQRFACAIAEAVNETIKDGLEVDDKVYSPNPKVRAQFGKNKKGLPYLTFGLMDPRSRKLYTLTFQGANNVPIEMAMIAVKHDQGQRAPTVIIPLPLDNAVVYETGQKYGKKNDPRPNHDTDKNNKRYPRKNRTNHKRICEKDVKNILRQMSRASA